VSNFVYGACCATVGVGMLVWSGARWSPYWIVMAFAGRRRRTASVAAQPAAQAYVPPQPAYKQPPPPYGQPPSAGYPAQPLYPGPNPPVRSSASVRGAPGA
jgi:hypothetical protein